MGRPAATRWESEDYKYSCTLVPLAVHLSWLTYVQPMRVVLGALSELYSCTQQGYALTCTTARQVYLLLHDTTYACTCIRMCHQQTCTTQLCCRLQLHGMWDACSTTNNNTCSPTAPSTVIALPWHPQAQTETLVPLLCSGHISAARNQHDVLCILQYMRLQYLIDPNRFSMPLYCSALQLPHMWVPGSTCRCMQHTWKCIHARRRPGAVVREQLSEANPL